MTTETSVAVGLPALLRKLREESSTLMRQEVALAKSELKENSTRLVATTAQLAMGGLLTYAGIIVFLIGLAELAVLGLEHAGLPEAQAKWISPVAIGLITAGIGLVFFRRAKASLCGETFVPRRTVASLLTGKQWAERKLSPS